MATDLIAPRLAPTTVLAPAAAPPSARARLRVRASLGQVMALVAAVAAASALALELARPVPGVGVRTIGEWDGGRPANALVLTALVAIVGASIGAVRRAGPTETVAGIGLAAGALALYGGVRGTPWAGLWLPLFLLATVAVPLWVRRALPGDGRDADGRRRRSAVAAGVGLNVGLTVVALVALLLVDDVVIALMPRGPAASAVLPSPSYVTPTSWPSPPNALAVGYVPGTAEPPPLPLPPSLLPPEFAPPPPSVTLDGPSPGPP